MSPPPSARSLPRSFRAPHQSRWQGYPSRPVNLIVPFPPEGNTDIMARALQTEIVQGAEPDHGHHNKPGAAGTLGLIELSRAAATFFLVIAFWPPIRGEPVRWWALAVAAVFAALALLWPAALAPLNKCWTKLGVLLFRVLSPIVLGLLFYVAVTPIALLIATAGQRPVAIAPRSRCRELLDRQNPAGARA